MVCEGVAWEATNPGPSDGWAGHGSLRRLRKCRSAKSKKATAVDTENGSFPPDAQVQDSEEDVPVLSLSRLVPSGMERRPEFRLGTANRFEALTDEATSSHNVKKRVRDQDLQCAESQHNELLDALAFDLTIEDTDTESVFEEKAIRNESTRRKLVLINGTQQNSCDGEDTSEGEVEDLVEHEECEENQSEPGEESEEGSDKNLSRISCSCPNVVP